MKKEKLLEKAVNNPKNLRFSEFQKLLEFYGFEHVRTKGSHFLYKHSGFKKAFPIEERNGFAKEYQIKQFLTMLEENDVIRPF